METATRPAQEGTLPSDRNTGVTLEVHDAPQCSAVNDILARVGDKWSVRVVMALEGGSRRFNQLRRDIPAISQRMLTRTLRLLERDGLVSRTRRGIRRIARRVAHCRRCCRRAAVAASISC